MLGTPSVPLRQMYLIHITVHEKRTCLLTGSRDLAIRHSGEDSTVYLSTALNAVRADNSVIVKTLATPGAGSTLATPSKRDSKPGSSSV